MSSFIRVAMKDIRNLIVAIVNKDRSGPRQHIVRGLAHLRLRFVTGFYGG